MPHKGVAPASTMMLFSNHFFLLLPLLHCQSNLRASKRNGTGSGLSLSSKALNKNQMRNHIRLNDAEGSQPIPKLPRALTVRLEVSTTAQQLYKAKVDVKYL